MTYLIVSITVVVCISILYKRYFPVFGVHPVLLQDLDLEKLEIIDVRDYNESYLNPIEGTLNIPIAYLKRHYNEIPNKDLYLVTSSLIEKNCGIRFLRKRGFQVIGYTITDQNNLLIKQKSIKIEVNG